MGEAATASWVAMVVEAAKAIAAPPCAACDALGEKKCWRHRGDTVTTAV
jgi:hypothetical protein